MWPSHEQRWQSTSQGSLRVDVVHKTEHAVGKRQSNDHNVRRAGRRVGKNGRAVSCERRSLARTQPQEHIDSVRARHIADGIVSSGIGVCGGSRGEGVWQRRTERHDGNGGYGRSKPDLAAEEICKIANHFANWAVEARVMSKPPSVEDIMNARRTGGVQSVCMSPGCAKIERNVEPFLRGSRAVMHTCSH